MWHRQLTPWRSDHAQTDVPGLPTIHDSGAKVVKFDVNADIICYSGAQILKFEIHIDVIICGLGVSKFWHRSSIKTLCRKMSLYKLYQCVVYQNVLLYERWRFVVV